ncbi:hypothetical protein O181_119819 [Austropuccinia psidii MF-1]|uniref:Uncharacterized protein n=1 Tax=Austropuccinia psidii MF-1 TaxID=1389203 RepID=A0A9Q3KHZ2_9BASI|nr:hypothetical protein [Austropuccinia psidii MF-1]
MLLKAQTHFHTIRNVWVITPCCATQKSGMLIFVHEKTSAPPPGDLTPLPCLLSCLNWLLHPRLILSDAWHAYMPAPPPPMPPSPPSRLLTPSTYHPYARGCLPYMPPMLLTILTLSVPCQHASDARGVPSQHASDTAYHTYAHIVPSQYASNAAYHPHPCSALPTILQRCLASLCLQFPPNMPPTPHSHWPNPQGHF